MLEAGAEKELMKIKVSRNGVGVKVIKVLKNCYFMQKENALIDICFESCKITPKNLLSLIHTLETADYFNI